MNGNAWTVTDANGIAHQLGCAVKTFGGPEITVDGNTYKVKSSNFLVNVVDYSVDFPGVNCHIVMVGKKARLVVNGVYDDDKTPYEPVASQHHRRLAHLRSALRRDRYCDEYGLYYCGAAEEHEEDHRRIRDLSCYFCGVFRVGILARRVGRVRLG